MDCAGILKCFFPLFKCFLFLRKQCLCHNEKVHRHYSSQRGEVYLSRFGNVFHKFGFGNFPDTFCDEVWSNTVPAGWIIRLLEVFHHHQGQWVVLGEGEGIVGNGDESSVYSFTGEKDDYL